MHFRRILNISFIMDKSSHMMWVPYINETSKNCVTSPACLMTSMYINHNTLRFLDCELHSTAFYCIGYVESFRSFSRVCVV